MIQVDNELTRKGNVDVWEVDRIVGASRLGDGTCVCAVVWTAQEEEGGTWATAEELGLEEPHDGSGAGNDSFWHNHFGTGIQAKQSLLVQWEIRNDQPVRRGKRKQPSTSTLAFRATTSGQSSSNVLGKSQFLGYEKQRVRHSATGGLKPVHVKTHGTGEDEHWLTMCTLEAERDSSNVKSLSYSLGSSGGRFALKSWVLKEFVGYKFISKNSHLDLDTKTR
jgi:hypothetical protein